jgi:hypothetical protein
MVSDLMKRAELHKTISYELVLVARVENMIML